MPSSFVWIGLVAVWLFVLVPMLVNKRPRIRQTSDAALATRVLHRGDSNPVQRGPQQDIEAIRTGNQNQCAAATTRRTRWTLTQTTTTPAVVHRSENLFPFGAAEADSTPKRMPSPGKRGMHSVSGRCWALRSSRFSRALSH